MDIPPVISPREIKFEWSPELTRLAVRRYYLRRLRDNLGLNILFSVIALVAVAGLIFDRRPGMAADYWLPAAVCMIIVLLFVRAYFRATRTLMKPPYPYVIIRVEPESITFETDESISKMKWSALKCLWKFPDVWLLFWRRRAGYTALPVAALGPDLCKTIEDKVRENGGQIDHTIWLPRKDPPKA